MMDKQHIYKKFEDALKAEKIKLTPQRQAIFTNIMDSDEHRECDDIYNSLVQDDITVSKATIYRTLDILVKYDLIRKLVIGDGKAKYEPKIGKPHHDHMICIETGKIIEFDNDEIERLQEEEAEKRGYKIIKHVHQLFVKPIKDAKDI
tara:strand:+ start:1310 stop:1753 length:444 start_codon:yes stop_codon:yes gene_type:complete